ncbi:MAG TPA: 2-oxoacid:ferredoxin oxidoreductase subunit beta [Thermoanaerobaculia bacterium]|nr:2-oxoacid:ferredoxin oxidoreductase subunit beta [Thermoanaerobaculia bacterium]
MSSVTEPKAPATNRLGLTVKEYGGLKSTLCIGCGHDVITKQITQAFYEMGVDPYRVAKLSGIGCSSKTTAYFVERGHGFNAVHGRMPAVGSGVMLANRTLLAIGVSGDGDTASIGAGQFVHLLRRNIPMIYVVENNGVYGLTKGQFSATADLGSKLKNGVVNDLPAIDLCGLAIELGCSFVARSFSGDMKQLGALLKAAIAHRGTSLIDVISPCVTFNNHEGSTKSYKWSKDHEEAIQEIGFVPYFEDVTVEQKPGETQEVEMHDGSKLRLKALRADFDPTDRGKAVELLIEAREKQEFLTGLIYINETTPDFLTQLNMVDEPLATLPESKTRPPKAALDAIMAELS